MNLAVIGATGYVGDAVVRELAARGHNITAFARNPAKVLAAANVRAVAAEADGLRDERPVEVIPTAQFGQKVARGVGTVVNFGVLDKMEAKKRCKPYVARL